MNNSTRKTIMIDDDADKIVRNLLSNKIRKGERYSYSRAVNDLINGEE